MQRLCNLKPVEVASSEPTVLSVPTFIFLLNSAMTMVGFYYVMTQRKQVKQE